MTRGKHAELAANRRYAAAMEHIDRLTDQVAELKMRTKAVEAQAAQAATLRAERDRLRDDPVVHELVDTVDAALKQRAQIYRQWSAAMPDFMNLLRDLCEGYLVHTGIDRVEFLNRRYPKLCAFMWRDSDRLKPGQRFHYGTLRRLSDEAATRLEVATGLRGVADWDPDRDFAEVANDIADVRAMHLPPDEMRELLGLRK